MFLLALSIMMFPGCGEKTINAPASLITQSVKRPVTETIQISEAETTACKERGGGLSSDKRGDGKSFGICTINNKECETLALVKGECGKEGVDISNFKTRAGKYCALIGGNYKILEPSTKDKEEKGQCLLKNGNFCGAQDMYNGNCDYIRDGLPPSPSK